MALSTQTGSEVSAVPWKYDVFLSFRGTDTRKGFTDYLYDKLQWRGIRTFRDDPHLERGTTISPALLTAIKQSRFAIVVLSPNYATSTWCLLELSKIVETMSERGTILPIFYEVEPFHVRHQGGRFAEAFEEHEEMFGEGNKEVERWRSAFTKVANLAGWSSKNYRRRNMRVIVKMRGPERRSGTTKSPADFHKSIRGRRVVVNLNSGVDYSGSLASLDGYMNISLGQTEDYVNGQLKDQYGDGLFVEIMLRVQELCQHLLLVSLPWQEITETSFFVFVQFSTSAQQR